MDMFDDYRTFYFQWAQQRQGRYNRAKNPSAVWTYLNPENLKVPLKIKPGKPLYEFKDVRFTVMTKAKGGYWLILVIQKIEEEAYFDFEELVKESGIKNVTGTSDHDRYLKTCRALWEYLIHSGQFIYPTEILN